MKDVDIVVVNFHTDKLLKECLDSLREFASKENLVSIYVVDVEVPLRSIAYFELLSDDFHWKIKYLPVETNCGYAKACNYGASQGNARNILFLNADTKLNNSQCIDYCVDFLDVHPEVAVVGPLQYNSAGQITHAGFLTESDRSWKQRVTQDNQVDEEVLTVSGSAYFVKRKVWEEMEECSGYGFLETPMYYEERYLSWHVKEHGYQVWYLGNAEMIHEHDKSPHGLQGKVQESKRMYDEAVESHGS